MSARRLALCALEGLPLIAPGDDLAGLLAGALRQMQIELQDGDVMKVQFEGFGRALHNPLRKSSEPDRLVAVRPLI